ncbi:MAG: hypothetical protein JXR42_04885 [Gammaproteobacteria bacterium]|nr:hypothetical protein [Gammaproteobacteria bacterium]
MRTRNLGCSIVKVSKQEAQAALLKAGKGEHIDVQLVKLDMLEATAKLAIKRIIRPSWAANITSGDKGHRQHQKIISSLPIFYLAKPKTAQPVVTLSNKTNRRSKVRTDFATELEPFLLSISAYRYKTGSFNFSKAANKYNAENVLIIKDRNLAKQYINNWEKRCNFSLEIKN